MISRKKLRILTSGCSYMYKCYRRVLNLVMYYGLASITVSPIMSYGSIVANYDSFGLEPIIDPLTKLSASYESEIIEELCAIEPDAIDIV